MISIVKMLKELKASKINNQYRITTGNGGLVLDTNTKSIKNSLTDGII